MSLKRVFLGASLLLAAGLANANVNLLTNGGFETTGAAVVQGWGGYTYGANYSPNMPGWTVNSGSVDIVPSSYTALTGAAEGSNFLDLNGWEQGSISQTFATVVGQLYELSFSYSLNGNTVPALATVTVAPQTSLNSALMLFTVAPSYPPLVWTNLTRSFVAQSSGTTLTFDAFLPAGASGILLDNVSVTAVPEPTSLALMLAGLGAVGFMIRRRQV